MRVFFFLLMTPLLLTACQYPGSECSWSDGAAVDKALKSRDVSVCEKVSGEACISECRSRLGQAAGDLTQCALASGTAKDDCILTLVRRGGPKSFCAGITDSAKSAECQAAEPAGKGAQ